MTVSKRLRYEVLLRDDFTCRYCGAYAPIVPITVDHVVPQKHGGADVASNLVAACGDCNNGKAVSMPSLGLVAEVEEKAAQWERERNGTPDEDDLFEMRVHQRCLDALEGLSGEQVLHLIARAFSAAMPYRPTHAELIRAAGGIALDDARKANA